MNILIVEDSLEMQVTLKKLLSGTGADVACAISGQEMRSAIENETPDLVLLDAGLADEDGFQLFAELQGMPGCRDVPVIFITGRGEITSKVAAFALGAEDYIVKPFNALEVKARLEARVKKISERVRTENVLERGELKIYVDQQRVTLGTGLEEKKLSLTPKEYKLLFQLAKSPDLILSRDQLMDSVWGSNAAVFDRTVDTHISTLRKKLGPAAAYIESVLGTGYRFTSARKPAKANAA